MGEETNPKVTRIDKQYPLKTTRVVVYCRVSSNSVDLVTKFVQSDILLYSSSLLVDVLGFSGYFIDVETGSNTTKHNAFQQMMEDSIKDKFDNLHQISTLIGYIVNEG